MGSAAFAYACQDDVIAVRPTDRAHAPRTSPRLRPARRNKMPLRTRMALVLGGALLGWAVPIACAVTLL